MNKRCPNTQQILLCDCTEGRCQVKDDQKRLLTEIMEADARDGLYKQQTAVEWLFNWMSTNQYFIGNDLLKALEEAKEMEKEQINRACYDGYYQEEWYDVRNYYNETYNK